MGNLPSKPADPPLTEKNLPDQSGKVFLITGATSGIGRELAHLLYAANARVWIAARSESKVTDTIASIRQNYPKSQGDLSYVIADFNDLTTIPPAVQDFLQHESRLDVLYNNAGIMIPPKGTSTKQGHEAQLGVNTLAPFLFARLLKPILTNTAANSEPGSTRVVWVSSSAARGFSPPGGVDMSNLSYQREQGQWHKYGVSKAGNILHASEFARRSSGSGIISVSIDPGNLDSDLYQHMPRYQHWIAQRFALKPPIFGAYTELFAGLSSEVNIEHNGGWIVPWGKIDVPREDISESCKSKAEGGSGVAADFWDWSEKVTSQHI